MSAKWGLPTKWSDVMAYLREVPRCKIFHEFTPEEQRQHFSIYDKKVIHNIDTLYYSVYLDESDEKRVGEFVNVLKDYKEQVMQDRGTDYEILDFLFTPFSFSIYSFCLRVENMYDVFISSYLPNKNTPRIVVQLRSVSLWVDGVHTAVENSIQHLQRLLDCFGVRIERTMENRFDYAFHTNSIQNGYRFFGDKALLRSLKTSLRKYQKVGDIGREITIDYFALGMRDSNNIFFRAYNKTKEVIEENYKSFFIDYWYENKLISAFDKYCLEHAYRKGSYNALIEGRCLWYLEYGKDMALKAEIKHLLNTCLGKSDNYEFLDDSIRGIIPEVTMVMNIEFQTKRKFYHTFEKHIGMWKCSRPDSPCARIYKIIDNRKAILDYLTTYTVCFKSGQKVSAWWQRVQSCRIRDDIGGKFIREYTRKLDKEKLKRRIVNSVAAYSLYNGNFKPDMTTDFSDFISVLNDNDVYGGSIALVDTGTGAFADLNQPDYAERKKKKERVIRRLLPKVE